MKKLKNIKQKVLIVVVLFFSTISTSQTVTINWDTILGQVPDKMYGLNIWDGTLNGINNDIEYKTAISDLNLSLVRYHAYETTVNSDNKSWYNTATQLWRTNVIDGCLQAQNASNKLISIFNFPQWLSSDGFDVKKMNVSNAQLYADWCADLVDIVNVQLGRDVKYWSVFNELETNFNSNIQDLATIYLACYTKMKLVDPTIKIGAFAITQPWWNNSAQFAFYQATNSNLDFIDYHIYGGEFSSPANNLLYNSANYLGYGGADNVRNLANLAGVPSTVPIWLSESNIVYSYTNDPAGKMASNVGAVWDAVLFESAIKANSISSIMLFNDRDGVYGKLAANNTKRPAYHNLKILSNNFYGDFVSSTTSDSELKILAVKGTSTYSIMLCNSGLSAKTVNLNFVNGPLNAVICKKIELKNQITESLISWNNASTYRIPSEGIVLFSNALQTITNTSKTTAISLINNIVEDGKIFLKSEILTSATIEIMDISARKMVSFNNQNLQVGTNTIDVSDLHMPKGFFFIKIVTKNNFEDTFKIICN
jgi:hypothetical protein